MCLLFETIRVKNYKPLNYAYHNCRIKNTLKDIFNVALDIDIRDFIKPKFKNCKVKLVYSKSGVLEIIYSCILKRIFNKFKIVNSDIKYAHKYLDRQEIDKLLANNKSCDDIIICDFNMLKDTSIANIAIYTKEGWLTPKNPILKGTMRQKLLDKKLLKEYDITQNMLVDAKKIAIMNAIIGFYKINNFELVL